jgi:hypothetical protein
MRMMNEFEAQVLSDLSVLKSQMTALTGDGNGAVSPRSNTAWKNMSKTGNAPRAFWRLSAYC